MTSLGWVSETEEFLDLEPLGVKPGKSPISQNYVFTQNPGTDKEKQPKK